MMAPSTHAAGGSVRLGALSDRTGRKPFIVWGMWIQAAGIGVTTLTHAFAGFVVGAVLLGIGAADAFGLAAAMWVIAALTFVSGVVSATRLAETLPPGLRATPHADRESGTSMHGPQPHLAVDTRWPD